MNSTKFSLRSRFISVKYALHGFCTLLKNEHNSRIHLLAALCVIVAGFIADINLYEWSLLVILIGMVFLTELLNSAIETLSDHVEPQWNEAVKKVKDYSAAAVLVSAIISIIVGVLIFLPKLLRLI